MESDSGSVFWMIAVAGGPILLGLVIAYAAWQWRQRGKNPNPDGGRVTRRNYQQERE